MTRNPANSANADDSWEQLEADLFGIEVGKEHTATERIASEPIQPAPAQPIAAVPKPIEEDDFGDFGAGLVESAGTSEPPRKSSSPPRPRKKPVPPAESAPVKALPIEPAPAFKLSDLDDGPTDEELDEASDEDEAEEEGASVAAEDDPYWDPLANWNWQEDDRSGKPRSESSHERPQSRGPGGRSDGPQRGGPRGRSSNSDRRPPQPRDSRHVATEDRGLSAPRRPAPERDRSRLDEVPVSPVSKVPEEVEREQPLVADEGAHSRPDVKSRRQDRRRSRRHSPSSSTAADENLADQDDRLEEATEEGWPADVDTSRSASAEPPRSRALPGDDLDDDFEEEEASETDEDSTVSAGEEERAPRRRRSRRRRRRPDRPASALPETAADEDIKHLEEDVEDDDLEQSATEDATGDDEGAETDRPSRPRRPRRRRRGPRTDRPAPAPAARVERQPEYEDDEDEDSDEDDEEEVLASDSDDEFDEDQDRQFVEDDEPARSSRRPGGRSRRSASDAPFVRHIEDDDDEDSEPEPAVSYEDVPSWEEAISYLLNPSMVEGAGGGGGGDRGDRPPPRSGERSSRPPRRGPRRDS